MIQTLMFPDVSGPSPVCSFDDFWRVYPRKIGKGAARKAYDRAVKKLPAHEIQFAAEAYARLVAGKDPKYIPHPTTWLNQERWADEPDPVSRKQATIEILERMGHESDRTDF